MAQLKIRFVSFDKSLALEAYTRKSAETVTQRTSEKAESGRRTIGKSKRFVRVLRRATL